MRCDEVARTLNRLQVEAGGPGAEPFDERALGYLIGKRLVAKVDDGNGIEAELVELREKLRRLQEGRPPSQLPAPEEAQLRARVLELAERAARASGSVDVAGTRYALTYAGRTELSTLMTRLGRVGEMSLEEFDRQMEVLRNSLRARAERASYILKVISPALSPVDEVHLRSSAVGLAGANGSPQVLADAYIVAFHALGRTSLPARRHPLLAEGIVLARGANGAEAASRIAQEIVDLKVKVAEVFPQASLDDHVNMSLLLFPHPPGEREAILKKAAAFGRLMVSESSSPFMTAAPVVLLASTGFADMPRASTWVNWMRARLTERGVVPGDAEMATAIMGSSRGEAGDELLLQYDRAVAYMSRLAEGSMTVGGAMLAVLPTGIEESLDDLRMASGQVSANKLSLGGMETLSLGLKLLLQTSVLAGGGPENAPALQVGPEEIPLLSALGLTSLALVVPTAIAAISTFHEITVHQAAVSHYHFHPVHTHYIYG